MIRIACYALFGLVGLLIQTSIFPNVLPFQFKPDLILILVVYLGICQKYGYSGVLSFCFGLLYDVFAGSSFGLHGMVLLLVVLIIRSTIDYFNAENPFLLLFLVACGTVLQAGLLVLFGMFAEAGALWQIVLQHLPEQLLANIVTALLLMLVVTYLQRRFPRLVVPGMQRLDERYEG